MLYKKLSWLLCDRHMTICHLLCAKPRCYWPSSFETSQHVRLSSMWNLSSAKSESWHAAYRYVCVCVCALQCILWQHYSMIKATSKWKEKAINKWRESIWQEKRVKQDWDMPRCFGSYVKLRNCKCDMQFAGEKSSCMFLSFSLVLTPLLTPALTLFSSYPYCHLCFTSFC